MKRIVSVSIGSSGRNKSVETEILGEKYSIERIGTDGDIQRAIEMIRELDGRVQAFGMGGIDLYLTTGASRKYIIREAVPIMQAAEKTPIVDGTGIKNTLEKRVVEYLHEKKIIDLRCGKVLITSAADRFRMAETFANLGYSVTIGDLIFVLGIPLPIRSLNTFRRIADLLIPLVTKLPFEVLYPTGEKQKENHHEKFTKFYDDADIIAGDFHYIKKYMPLQMKDKIIVTNTVTPEDAAALKTRGVRILVTTTPEWDGRSFGTNVVEALLISSSGKRPEELTEGDYYGLIEKLNFKPRIEYL